MRADALNGLDNKIDYSTDRRLELGGMKYRTTVVEVANTNIKVMRVYPALQLPARGKKH